MNRIITAAFVIMVAATAAMAVFSPEASLQLTGESANGLKIEATLPSMAEIVSSPNMAGTAALYGEDSISVPAITRWIIVPVGCSVSAHIENRSSRSLDVQGNPTGVITDNELANRTLWPPEPFSISRVGVYRGVPIAAVNFYPLQLAGDGSGVENSQFNMTIEFNADASAPHPRQIHDIPGSRATRVLNELAINPPHRDQAFERQSDYLEHMLFVRSTAMDQNAVAYIDTLAEWKRSMGYKVSIWVVDLGQDDPISIRSYIRDNYFNDVSDPISSLIIMGGDSLNANPFFPSTHTQGDHFYSLMDDEDEFISDISVGRMYALGSIEFRAAVKRTVFYERQPFVQGGEEWFHHALYTAENIAAPGGQFVPSMIQLGRWIWYRWNQEGYHPIDTLYTGSDPEQAVQVNVRVGEILQREGVSIAISRGWLQGCMVDVDRAVQTGRRNPFVTAITCLSSSVTVPFFRSAQLNNLTGPVAAFAIWGLTHSKTNNCLMGGQVRAMYELGYTQPGLIQNYSKIQLWADYAYAQDTYQEVRDLLLSYRLLGDPTVDIFTDTPDSLKGEHLTLLTPGSTAFNVDVTRGGDVFPEAVVCVRQGEMMLVAIPGNDGVARFNFRDGLAEGAGANGLRVTITGHNSVPYFATIPVQQQGIDLVMTGYELSGDNQIPEGGETVHAIATIHNPTGNQIDDINVAITTESPWIAFDPDTLAIESIGADDDATVEFDILLNRSVPNNEKMLVNLHLTSGDRSWDESFEFASAAPTFVLTNFGIGNGDNFDRDQSCRLLPQFINNGRASSVDMDAELISLDPEKIEVTVAQAQYRAAASGQTPTLVGNFTVRLGANVIPGTLAEFDLILRATNGDTYSDTIRLTKVVGRRSSADPLGPDEYGYLCFDSYDSSWAKHPIYGWREINPSIDNHEFEGTRLPLEDWDEDLDNSTVLDLPFTFTYYGEEFDQITVCSNGWLAFGEDKSMFIDFRNTQIPGVLGPDAQLAVLWDDLIINDDYQNRGVYFYYNEAEQIYIVEWSRMQAFRDRYATAQEAQIILKNPAQWPTRSGDGEIVYQYKTFLPAEGNLTDNQYCTIGIKNLDGTDGLQVTYWDQWFQNQGVRRLEDGMALLFTTDLDLITSSVSGHAALFEDANQAVRGAEVVIPGVATTVSDANGDFTFPRVPIGSYTVLFNKFGYNQGQVAVTVREGENSVANVLMTHPVPRITQQSVEAWLDPGDENGTFYLTVGNIGNGPLDFKLEARYTNGAASQLPQMFKVGIYPLDPDYSSFQGVEIVGQNMYVTSVGDIGDPNDNYIIMLDHDGREITRFHQPIDNGFGFSDLAFDGEYLWGGRDSMVVRFDLVGNVERTIQIPVYDATGNEDLLPHPNALAWNPERNTLVMTYLDKNIYEMNIEGEIVDQHRFPLPRHVPKIYGLAWNSGDIDGMPLYAIIQEAPDGKDVMLAKTNFAESKFVKQLSTYNQEKGKGLAISTDWSQFKTVAAVVCYANGPSTDTLRLFEIGPDTRGLKYEHRSYRVPANDELEVSLQFASKGIEPNIYRYSLVTFHNANADSIVTPVNFRVEEGAGVGGEDLLPKELTLEPAYPNPFNNVTRLNFVLPNAGRTLLSVYDVQGREVARLFDGELKAGRHVGVWNAEAFGSGIYFVRLEADGTNRTVRTVLLK